jgi:hypothetical protein
MQLCTSIVLSYRYSYLFALSLFLFIYLSLYIGTNGVMTPRAVAPSSYR